MGIGHSIVCAFHHSSRSLLCSRPRTYSLFFRSEFLCVRPTSEMRLSNFLPNHFCEKLPSAEKLAEINLRVFEKYTIAAYHSIKGRHVHNQIFFTCRLPYFGLLKQHEKSLTQRMLLCFFHFSRMSLFSACDQNRKCSTLGHEQKKKGIFLPI